MRSGFNLLLLCMMAVNASAQNDPFASLHLGDPAPPLRVREWLKGTPVQRFEKGSVYVLEFWATWCIPCKAAMPRLSALAREYKDKVHVIGVDIMEKKSTSLEKIKAFVDSRWIIM
ncbi:MAG: TlpA family protein disulfide reductase [Williamsia sp.]|nr:TlpA family protein disulfide reductase [Williamsia sp.]